MTHNVMFWRRLTFKLRTLNLKLALLTNHKIMKENAITSAWTNVDEYLRSDGVIQPGTILYFRTTNKIFGVYLFHDETSTHVIGTDTDWKGIVLQIQRYKLLINLAQQPCLN